jgi:hypothetical protein
MGVKGIARRIGSGQVPILSCRVMPPGGGQKGPSLTWIANPQVSTPSEQFEYVQRALA